MGDEQRKRNHWLASYPKSGNTWVRMFLSAYHRGGELDINRVTHSCGDMLEYWYQVVAPRAVADMDLADYLLLRPAALLHLTTVQLGDPLVVKTHNANVMVDRCQLQPPQLTVNAIYVVRDPRDVVISWAEHLDYGIDETIGKMADTQFLIRQDRSLPHILSTWSQHVTSWTVEASWPTLVVKYEDMVDAPEKTFRSVLRALGFAVDEDRLRAAIAATGFEKLRKREEEEGFAERRHQERFFGRGTHGHWRTMLTEAQVAQIERDHGAVMRRLGYTLTTEAAEAA